MTEMSVARGLAQVKLLEKRIQKTLAGLTAKNSIACLVKSSTPEDQQKEFIESAESRIQSITDLIKERQKIKSAILLSNAATTIQIGNSIFTVAEVIDKKTSIKIETEMLDFLKRAYYPLVEACEQKNQIIDAKSEQNAVSILNGTDENKESAPELFSNLVDKYIEKNKILLLAPTGLESKIEEMENDIDIFEADIDHLLSESNIKTMIQV